MNVNQASTCNVDAVRAAIEVALTETRGTDACPELSRAVDRALTGCDLYWDFLLWACQAVFGQVPLTPDLPMIMIRIQFVCFAALRVGWQANQTYRANTDLARTLGSTGGAA